MVKNHVWKEEKTVEDNFDYESPDCFVMDVTESSLVFAKANTVTWCINPLGGVVRFKWPLKPNAESIFKVKISNSSDMCIYIGVDYVDKSILNGWMGDIKE